MYKEPTKEELNKLCKMRAVFRDYDECLVLIFTEMPEKGNNIWLNKRIICSESEDVREAYVGMRRDSDDYSDPVHFVTIDGTKWYAIESIGFFLIYNEDYSKNYYLTIA